MPRALRPSAIGSSYAKVRTIPSDSPQHSSDMTRLADFIVTNREPILAEWEAFARSCAPAGTPSTTTSAIAARSVRRSAVNETIKPSIVGQDQRNDAVSLLPRMLYEFQCGGQNASS